MICQGCGQSFSLPAGYSRSKIQCSGCGVICTVTAETASDRTAPSQKRPSRQLSQATVTEPSIEDQAAALWQEPASPPPSALADESTPVFADESTVAPVADPLPTRRKELLVPCRRCGKLIRRQRECPDCDAAEEPLIAKIGSLELDEPSPPRSILDEDDPTPYQLADKDIPTCPSCRKELPKGGVVCPGCGFDRRNNRKVTREFEPIHRVWDADMSLETRLRWLAAAQGFHWLLALLAVLAGQSVWPFFIAWPFFTAMLCFVLGTFDRITLTRDRRGRTRLIKQWRCFFVPLQPVTTEVRGFEGVTTGRWHDAGLLEWLVVINLIPLGLIPAIIYWYNAIHCQHCHVALALNHGHAEVWVYRGRSEQQMNDIADTLGNASGLRRIV